MTLKNMLFTTMASAAALALPLGAASAQTDTGAGLSAEVQSTVDAAADPAASPPTEAGAQANAQATAGESKVVAVTEADVKAGDAVHDTSGASVGTIESVGASGAVISTGKSRIQVPLTSLGKNDKGLVIAMSKAELDAAAEASKPK